METQGLEVSIFEGVTNAEPTEERMALKDVLKAICEGDFEEEVEEVRYLRKEDEIKESEARKKQLWAFTPSGVFAHRNKDNLIDYSGIICLDFDDLSETDLKRVRLLVERDPHTLCCFLSPSGNGLKVLTRVDSPMEMHDFAYMTVGTYYRELTEVSFDSSCRDLPRLCFISWDKKIYINGSAEQFCIPTEPTTEVNPEEYSETLSRCREFTNQRQSFVKGNRNSFIHQFACNANRMGVPEPLTIKYSVDNFVSADLSSEEIASTVKSGYNNPNEFASYGVPIGPNHFALSVIDLIEGNKGKPQNIPIWSGITQPSIGFIYGPSKSGKSTFSESLGMSIAIGRKSFFDKLIVGQRKVLLVSLEEYVDLRTNRLESQIRGLSDEEKLILHRNYFISPSTFPQYILGENDWNALKKLIQDTEADVVFIDSLSHINPGSPIEDSTTAVGIMKKFRDIAVELNVALILIHHTPKDVSAGKPLTLDTMAGSRILLQEAEFIYGINTTPMGRRYFKTVAQRYVREDDRVTTFELLENGWAEMVGRENEQSLMLDFDGRSERTNYNLIDNYIQETSEISAANLEAQFVGPGTMSRGTLYNNLEKLLKDDRIVKPANGLYRSKE